MAIFPVTPFFRLSSRFSWRSLILAADGHRETADLYAPYLAVKDRACYTPLYGSLPVGQAFDLAIGVQLMTADGHSITCLKFGRENDVSVITARDIGIHESG